MEVDGARFSSVLEENKTSWNYQDDANDVFYIVICKRSAPTAMFPNSFRGGSSNLEISFNKRTYF